MQVLKSYELAIRLIFYILLWLMMILFEKNRLGPLTYYDKDYEKENGFASSFEQFAQADLYHIR